MSDQNLQAQIDQLLQENAALKAKQSKAPGLTLKVSEKGAVSIYGLNSRFPVTLYKSQLNRLFSDETVARVRQFVVDNDSKLTTKE